MNPIHATRLLNVAKALRESKQPEKFDMGTYVASVEGTAETEFCGTPACAVGHYASRPDLQDLLAIKVRQDGLGLYPYLAFAGTVCAASYVSEDVLEHFGITEDEADELFDEEGCGDAKTPVEAAEYIERFVADRGGAK